MATTITESQINSWDKNGQTKFLDTCSSNSGNSESLYALFYDLSKAMIEEQLTSEQITGTVKSIIENDKCAQIPFISVLSVLDIEYYGRTDHKKYIELVHICKDLMSHDLLRVELDYETQELAKIIVSKKVTNQRYIRYKTKHYFKQHKYNMLREESEGFSKVIRELDQMRPNNWESVVNNIETLSGRFCLCPMRILDLILDLFEKRPQYHRVFEKLMKKYFNTIERASLNQVLGLRFRTSMYKETKGADPKSAESLYRLTAFMISYDLVDVDVLMMHMTPSLKDSQDEYKQYLEKSREICDKLPSIAVSINTDDIHVLPTIKMNQKLAVINELLKIGSFKQFFSLVEYLPQNYVLSQQNIMITYCKVLHHIIQPLYIKYSGLPAVFTKRWRSPTTSLKFQCVSLNQCTTLEHLPSFFDKLRFLGPHMACDTLLYVKVTRVCASFLRMYMDEGKPKQNEKIFLQLKSIITTCLLPGLSLMQYNCCVSEEMWQLISLYSYGERYTFYSLWKKNSFFENDKHPLLMKAISVISSKTKYVLKRITKENIKEYGRQIGKLSHSNPVVLFHHVLNQIQQFDNFIIPIVDSLKYLTSMTYDVLAFSIVESVTNNKSDRLKYDDTNVSIWLQSLANFSATVFKKYPIDLAGLLQYCISTLTNNQSDDLVLLRELVLKMSGIEISENMTRDQLDSMSGGPLLLQGAYFTQNLNTKKSSIRLRDCILQYDLSSQLLILIAQQRQFILYEKKKNCASYIDPYNEDKRPLKLIGHLFDLCQETLLQFMSFIYQYCTIKDITSSMPELIALLKNYGLSVEVAFSLTRTGYKQDIWEHYQKAITNITVDDPSHIKENDKSKLFSEAYADVMGPVVDMVERVFDNSTWEGLSHEIFTIFWTLTLSDLEVPTEAYTRQTYNINTQIKGLDDSNDMSWSKKKKEKEKLLALYEKLLTEQRKQEDNVIRVLEYFEANADNWFNSKSAKVGPILMQLMIFPRCAFTSLDAIYAAKFLILLHRIKLPNFYSLICFDKIFIEIALPMSLCTENEAERYGRFLFTLLTEINRWHSDENIYNRECLDHPGFNTCFKGCMRSSTSNSSTQLDYENYRHIVHKWHHSITKLFVFNLETGEYQRMKTSLIIMKQILPVYPIVEKLGMALKRRVTRVCENEKTKRPDLWALAMGYLGQMNNRMKMWINENAFHEDKSQKSSQAKKAKRDNQKTDYSKDSDTSVKKRKVENSNSKEKRSRDDHNDMDVDKKSKSVNSPREKTRSSRSASQNRKN